MAGEKVIDSLIVTLGLDPSQFLKGLKEVDKELGKTRTIVVKSSNEMGKAINGAARSFAFAFLSLSSLNRLARNLTGVNESARQLGLLAKNTGTGVQNLKNYANAFQVAGGSAEGFLQTIEQLQQLQGRAQMTGVSGWERFLNVLNVGLLERGDDGIIRARDKLKVLSEISDALVERSKKLGRPAAYSFATEMGFDPATINVLLQGSAAIRKAVAEQEKLTQNQLSLSESAARLKSQWDDLRTKADSLAGVLLQKLQQNIEKLFGAFNSFTTDGAVNLIDDITGAVDRLRIAITGVIDLSNRMELPKWFKIINSYDPTGWLFRKLTGQPDTESKDVLSEIPGTWQSNRAKYLPTVRDAARLNEIPEHVLEGIINRESRWNSDVISGKKKSSVGATGIAQLRPEFFPNAGKNADADIWTAAEYLAKLKNQFGDWEQAAAAYNAGPGTLNAVKAGRGGLPTETRNYVDALFGAGSANRVAAPVGTGTVLAPSAGSSGAGTTIGTINLYPAAGTPETMRRELVRAIERKGLVNQADYGVRP